MAANLDLLTGLKGKQGDIARAIHAGNFSDQEVAVRLETTVQYVQKIKSWMRRQGFDVPKYHSPLNSGSNGLKGAPHPNNMLLVDRLSREDIKMVYTLLQKHTPPTQVAIETGLAPHIIMELWDGWQQLLGRQSVSRLCKQFGPRGVKSFVKIDEYLRKYGQTPDDLLNFAIVLEHKNEHLAAINEDLANAGSNLAILKDEVEGIEAKRQEEEKRLTESGIELQNLTSRITQAAGQLERLNEMKEYAKKVAQELSSENEKTIQNIAKPIVEKLMLGDALLGQAVIQNWLGWLQGDKYAAIGVLQTIAKGLEAKLSTYEFMKTCAPLLKEASERLAPKSIEKIKEGLMNKVNLRLIEKSFQEHRLP